MRDDRAVQDAWQRRIERANQLAGTAAGATQLLTRYAAILAAQRTCYDTLLARGGRLTGAVERDLAELRPLATELFGAIASVAPAQAMQGTPTEASAIDAMLIGGWRASSIPFLARIVLQPYAEALATLAGSAGSDHVCRPPDRHLHPPPGAAVCPFCGGPPQVAVLRGDGDRGGRTLVCATCATEWPVRRILCAYCGEEDERRLGYFHAPEFDHLRVDVCETCRHYLKTVDLTRLGHAVPIIDEVAAGVLDLWAQERRYKKVTPNLIGL